MPFMMLIDYFTKNQHIQYRKQCKAKQWRTAFKETARQLKEHEDNPKHRHPAAIMIHFIDYTPVSTRDL